VLLQTWLLTFFGFVAFGLNGSSGSSSDGVGNTLNCGLVELLLGALAGVAAGVAEAADFLFRGDVRPSSSYIFSCETVTLTSGR
jgi:hypothetical protein